MLLIKKKEQEENVQKRNFSRPWTQLFGQFSYFFQSILTISCKFEQFPRVFLM